MGPIMFFWWLGSFVFFKVALDASFSQDTSVVSTVLLGAMVAISVFLSGYFYSTKMLVHLARVRLGEESRFFSSTRGVWILSVLANICLGKAIIFGFSKNLNRDVGGGLLFDFGRYGREDALLFAALISIPITFHYLTILISVNTSTDELHTSAQNSQSDSERD